MLIEEMPLCYQLFCNQVETGCEYDIKVQIPVRNQNAIDIYMNSTYKAAFNFTGWRLPRAFRFVSSLLLAMVSQGIINHQYDQVGKI